MKKTLQQKIAFLQARARNTQDGCLISTPRKGHTRPAITYNGINSTAARWILIEAGYDMTDLEAAHLCGNECCLAPAHLKPLTKTENLKERDDPAWLATANTFTTNLL